MALRPFVILAALLAFLSVSSGYFPQTERFLTTPILAWSPTLGTPTVFPNTISSFELQASLLSLLGLGENESPLFSSLGSAPELLIFFIEPAVSTQDLLIYSGAHTKDSSASSPFSNLRNFAELKQSVLLENLALSSEELSTTLQAIVKQQQKAHVSSTTIIAAPENARMHSFDGKHTSVPLSGLQSFLSEHKDLGNNGVTDLLFVFFSTLPGTDDLPTAYAQDAATISAVLGSVETLTQDYVAIFSSESAPSVSFFELQPKPQPVKLTPSVIRANQVEFVDTRFTPAVTEGLMLSLVLLIILFVGVCCLCFTQTPDRFPEAPREGQQNHVLYPQKN